jgi:murein DD-endopeptidase MepM/ murein hydrolase activator NlpD
MREERWTFLLIPHGSESPRGFSLSRKALKTLGSIGAALGLVVLIAFGVLLAQATGGRGLMLVAPQLAMEDEIAVLRQRLLQVQDTLDIIARRNQQIRVLVGLPDNESSMPRMTNATFIGELDGMEPAALIAASEQYGSDDIDSIIRRATDLAISFAEVADTLETKYERLARIPSIMPTAGWLSSAFSRNRIHPILHVARPHEGIDVSAPMGTPIIAPAAGTVKRVARERGYGLLVEIDHGDGMMTRYAHCSRVSVKAGQRVRRGQEIANVGNSGLSAGPHLHYEIHVNGRLVDPLTFVLPQNVITD